MESLYTCLSVCMYVCMYVFCIFYFTPVLYTFSYCMCFVWPLMVACLQVRSLEKELEEHKPNSGRSGHTAVSVGREGCGWG